MSKLFHNLSFQVLSNVNEKAKIKISPIAGLVKNINYMLEKKLTKTN